MRANTRLVHIITGLSDGGAEAVLYRLCTRDEAYRHAVVSLMDMGKYGPLLEKAGIPVYCLNIPRGRIPLVALLRLWRLLRNLRPELVQTWMYHADLIGGISARVAGIRPVVWGVRNTTLEPGESSRTTILIARVLARFSRWVPRRIAVCAQKAVEVHGALGYDTSIMRVIPNGYDLTQFMPSETTGGCLRAEWGVPPEMPLLGLVGRFDPQKDHGNLFNALVLIRERGMDFLCILVGTGLEEDNGPLVSQISSLGLQRHIKLLGRRNDIPSVMNALDLHVLSSAYGEAFPNVLAEAMACATPCVTTDVGDAALIVGDSGWVVPPRDSSALADAIEMAMIERADREKWMSRCQASRNRVAENFGIDRMVASYQSVWRDALNEAE